MSTSHIIAGCDHHTVRAPQRELLLPPADTIAGEPPAKAIEAHRAKLTTADQLIAQIDRVGHDWEVSLARRATKLAAVIEHNLRDVIESLSELHRTRTLAAWLRTFPRPPSHPGPPPDNELEQLAELALATLERSPLTDERLRQIAALPATSRARALPRPPQSAPRPTTPGPAQLPTRPDGTSAAPDGCPLSPRQLDILRGLRDGLRYKQIAAAQQLSESTVRTHCHHAYTRLGVQDRTQAVLEATARGWL